MGMQGIVVQPGQGLVASYTPGRSIVLKLRCDETDGSIMMFEASVPAGATSTLHLHHDSDEVAYVLSGEVTFLIGDEVTVGGPGTCAFMPRGMAHAWKSTGAKTGRVLFLYTLADAGRLFEEGVGHPIASFRDGEFEALARRHRWEVVGPPPL